MDTRSTVNMPANVRQPRHRSLLLLATLGLSLAAGGCAELEKEKVSRVVVEGPSSATVGSRIQLTASTENADDRAYTWESADEAIASVDDEGNVLAKSLGEVAIRATGTSTGLTGERVVVVTVNVDASVPNYGGWVSSAHNRIDDEAFTHWNEDGEVEVECARCHSGDGYIDYLGGDGSPAGVVDEPGTTQAAIDCKACHNVAAQQLSSVTFPSGVEIDGLGSEARCMVCHQGRASGADVDETIMMAGESLLEEPDTVSEELGFQNIHYYPAAATLYAGSVQGGYQYDGKVYDWRFRHVPELDRCVDCHDPHSLQVRVDECAGCHEGVETLGDLRSVRMIASVGNDYDGDGDASEGIAEELDGLRALLLRAIVAYARDQDNDAICYDSASYPYFFIGSDGSGDCGEGDANFGNRYVQWTPRLMRAAYNYQMASKDPGAFAHNAKYIIQLLFDSIEDLKSVGGETLDAIETGDLVREDEGHFNGAGEAARHWDEDAEVSATCSRCHAASDGLRAFVELGVSVPVGEPDNGIDCATCHDSFGIPGEDGAYATLEISSVTYPSGVTIESDQPEPSNLCRSCHQGRVAGIDIQSAIDRGGELSFMNVHYLAAGSVRLGSEVGLGFEYPGKTYDGKFQHGDINDCTSCHDPVATQHTFEAQDAYDEVCSNCHRDQRDITTIRVIHMDDYDGDGDTSERLSEEIGDLAGALLSRMQVVAMLDGGGLCYDSHSYPYFFTDTDGDGSCGPGEAIYPNAFDAWTPELVAAAHNYQISQTEPGAWAHNFDYMAQLLIDSIEDLGGDVSGLVRPD
jgi:predicted CXXCH cytochrome family protein